MLNKRNSNISYKQVVSKQRRTVGLPIQDKPIRAYPVPKKIEQTGWFWKLLGW